MNAQRKPDVQDELDAEWDVPEKVLTPDKTPTVRRLVLPELIPENEQTPTEQYPLPERTVLMMLFGRKEDWT